MMTPEELLKPRYKCIAPYPNMPCNVGDIFIEYKWDTGNCSYVTNPDYIFEGNHVKAEVIKNYPHLL